MMQRVLQRFGLVLCVASLGLLAACGGSDDDAAATPAAVSPKTVVEVAQSSPDFSVLVEAVVAADLAGTLGGAGPYTVFAPTNAAFAALLSELGLTKEQLLADKALLTAVLQYHVLPGRVKKVDVPLGQALTPLAGGVFKVEADSAGTLAVTDGRNRKATITATDVLADNGVVHVIDKVLLPADKTIVATAQALSDFSILVEAVVAAGLVDTLNGAGPFTVFAPTNQAFADLLGELHLSKEQLLADTPLLTQVLTYHVVPGRVLKAAVPIAQPITSVQGGTFTVGADLKITDQRHRSSGLVRTDVFASNGVIHVIDKVLLPAP